MRGPDPTSCSKECQRRPTLKSEIVCGRMPAIVEGQANQQWDSKAMGFSPEYTESAPWSRKNHEESGLVRHRRRGWQPVNISTETDSEWVVVISALSNYFPRYSSLKFCSSPWWVLLYVSLFFKFILHDEPGDICTSVRPPNSSNFGIVRRQSTLYWPLNHFLCNDL